MNQKEIIAQKLLQIKAIQLNVQSPFIWAAGWKSPIYTDNRKVLSFPYIREFIKSELCNEIFTKFPDGDLIAGVATGGIPWGAMAADQLKLPFVYVRSKVKDHGMGNQIEGFYEKGARVVVVEDLISTGKSSLAAVDALRNGGLMVEGMVSIFNYAFDVAKNAFKEKNVKLISLTDYPTLVKYALQENYIRPEDEKVLLNWRENPAEWGNLALNR